MESRIRLLTLVAVLPLLALIGLMGFWIYGQLTAPPPLATLAPSAVPTATELPTLTPTPTETPIPFTFPSPVATATATATRTPTATATRTPVPTGTPIPTNTRVVVRLPTQTPVPSATPTEVGGEFRFKPIGAPVLVRDRPCQAQNILFGWVKARDGTNLPNMLLRYIPQYGRPPEFPGVTRSGPDAGYYELTLGTAGNGWDIFLVDAADQPLSPTVHFVVPQPESGECWWMLSWIER